jgi:hypothetical protein
VDEELEKVVEFIGEGIDGARLGLGRGEGEGEREEGLVAGGEGNILEVAETVGNLYWARESVMDRVSKIELAVFRRLCWRPIRVDW